MFNGTVSLVAQVKGNGFSFAAFNINPHEAGVTKVEIEGPNGMEIHTTVHLSNVATHDDGRELAAKVNAKILDRLAYFHYVAIQPARSADDHFSPAVQIPGVHPVTCTTRLYLSGTATVNVGIPSGPLKTELEQASPPPGEHNFALFRSALVSSSPVEKFMHNYSILLMLYNDRQADVDAFIVSENPAVPQTQHPLKATGALETAFTRLRNELGHRRPGVNIDDTKAEMAQRVDELTRLVRRAIELHP